MTQESNWGLLHCRWILYQLTYLLMDTTNTWNDISTATFHYFFSKDTFVSMSYISLPEEPQQNHDQETKISATFKGFHEIHLVV